jgi:broad specificity phosphatase PhoE
MFRSLALTAFAAVMAMSAPAGADPNPDPPFDKAKLLAGLREGGYVIYIRHAQTEKDYADQVSAVMGDCSTQRMLSESGWKQSRAIGKALADLNIPVGTVLSSQYCRAWQTADLAFGRHEKTAALNFAPAEEYTAAQIEAMRRQLEPLVSAVPKAGANTVIVGHDDPFEAVSGIYPEPQGVAYILDPDGKSFTVLARIPADGWMALAQ